MNLAPDPMDIEELGPDRNNVTLHWTSLPPDLRTRHQIILERLASIAMLIHTGRQAEAMSHDFEQAICMGFTTLLAVMDVQPEDLNPWFAAMHADFQDMTDRPKHLS